VELLGRFEVDETVRIVGSLERRHALELQHAADALLVITEGSTRRSVATGKLFEYLAARRPILVLGDGTEAAKIVEDAGAGFAAPADEPKEIAKALGRLLEAAPSAGADPASLERYSYPQLAEAYAELIDEVIT
jgi:glycosyltransferase involved in cell wall biosynthesis